MNEQLRQVDDRFDPVPFELGRQSADERRLPRPSVSARRFLRLWLLGTLAGLRRLTNV